MKGKAQWVTYIAKRVMGRYLLIAYAWDGKSAFGKPASFHWEVWDIGTKTKPRKLGAVLAAGNTKAMWQAKLYARRWAERRLARGAACQR